MDQILFTATVEETLHPGLRSDPTIVGPAAEADLQWSYTQRPCDAAQTPSLGQSCNMYCST